jgi:outer membrane protein assembly factor BamC
MIRLGRRAAAAIAVAALAGCSSVGSYDSSKTEYKAAGKLPPLDIPPELTTPARDERHDIPDVSPTGTATFSAYSAERASAPKPGATGILPIVDKLKLERSGSERWLVVPEPPEKVWPKVKEFWQETGFLIKTERPEVGVMETDWAEDRSRVPEGGLRNLIGKLGEGLYSSGQRDKFRTRLDRGFQPDTTEIYISHRGMVEIYVNPARDTVTTAWQPRPSDPGLEAEFLRRMMVRFGMDEVRAKTELAALKKEERAKIVEAQGGTRTIELTEPFDRAWRRVGLVLDRAGFTVEDRNRSQGYYFVRYVDPEAEVQKDGFLSKLAFWRSAPDPKAAQYRVFVKDRKESSEIQVLNKEGGPDPSETARKILSLLQQQLN